MKSTQSLPSNRIRPAAHSKAGLLLGICLLAVLGGCGGSRDRTPFNDAMRSITGPSASELVEWAFDPNDSDKRREGIIGLSSRSWGLQEPYLKGYAALLRTDPDPMVRAAAARALGLAGDANYATDVTRGLLDREVAVRQDAATALDRVYDANTAMFLRTRALNDPDQDVRAKCCKALRHHRHIENVRALVDCLNDKEYSVRYQARGALVAIVGRDFGPYAEDWREVASARSLPPRPPEMCGRPWWDWMKVTRPGPDPNEPNPTRRP